MEKMRKGDFGKKIDGKQILQEKNVPKKKIKSNINYFPKKLSNSSSFLENKTHVTCSNPKNVIKMQ